VTFLTPAGLQPGAWLVLRRDGEWVDRSYLDPRMSRARPNVEIVVEPQTRVEALVASGEGVAVEFKEQIPDDGEGRRRVCRTVAAFANGAGGTILFGVTRDGAVVGVPGSAGRRERATDVSNFVKDIVDPLPDYDVEEVELETSGRVVVVLSVGLGVDRPYGVGRTSPTFYIRRSATTFPATQSQIRELARGDS